ncbi:hypothetical protein R84981_002906 [Carnimonas sp. R-84981]|uniref:DUF2612 domain-containing protein n=1 Tax=Carnimonas bestiolae TaxID=3402172 RepID=UPI003EDC499E
MDHVKKALSRIYFEYRNMPKLAAWVSVLPELGQLEIEGQLEKIIGVLDIDNAEGWQLDVLGRWVGIGRGIQTDITGVFFSWDTDGLGWDEARWKLPTEPGVENSVVGDDLYRTIIRLKIAVNNWDGTFATIPPLFDTVLQGTELNIDIIDNQDMTQSVIITGGPLENQLIGAITNEGLMLRCQGVGIKEISRPSDEDNGEINDFIFALDLENDIYRGLDEGAWAEEI